MPDLYLDMGAARIGVGGTPTYVNIAGTNAAIGGYSFPDAVTSTVFWQFKITSYTSGSLTLNFDGYCNSTTTNVAVFSVQLGAMTPGTDTTLWTTKALATAQTGNFTSRTTANSPITASITISNLDSLANNDDVILSFARTGGAGGDTLAVDAIITTAVLSWT